MYASLVAVMLAAVPQQDAKKLCEFVPKGGLTDRNWVEVVKLSETLGEDAQQVVQALGNLNPADRGAILREMARESGLPSCALGDAVDVLAGIDAASGCRKTMCSFDSLTEERVAALSRVGSKAQLIVYFNVRDPKQLPLLAKLPWLHELHLDSRDQQIDLAPVAEISALERLTLNNVKVASLDPLGKLTALTELRSTRITLPDRRANFAFAARLQKLVALELSLNGVEADLAPLGSLRSLKTLILVGVTAPTLAPLSSLTALQELGLPKVSAAKATSASAKSGATSVLAPLTGLKALRKISATELDVTDLSPLAELLALESLELRYARHLANVAPLAKLKGLRRLTLSDSLVQDVLPLSGLVGLEMLDLGSTKVDSVAALAGLTRLQDLRLRNTAVTDLSPLKALTRLITLDIERTQVKSLRPLHGLKDLLNLYARGCAADDAEREELEARLPRVHID